MYTNAVLYEKYNIYEVTDKKEKEVRRVYQKKSKTVSASLAITFVIEISPPFLFLDKLIFSAFLYTRDISTVRTYYHW